MPDEQKDKYVLLINPEGKKEQVWDFADHVDRLKSIGWTEPAEKVKAEENKPKEK